MKPWFDPGDRRRTKTRLSRRTAQIDRNSSRVSRKEHAVTRGRGGHDKQLSDMEVMGAFGRLWGVISRAGCTDNEKRALLIWESGDLTRNRLIQSDLTVLEEVVVGCYQLVRRNGWIDLHDLNGFASLTHARNDLAGGINDLAAARER